MTRLFTSAKTAPTVLPYTDIVLNVLAKRNIPTWVVAAHQHLVPTTPDLIASLSCHGEVVGTGKAFSSSAAVVDQLLASGMSIVPPSTPEKHSDFVDISSSDIAATCVLAMEKIAQSPQKELIVLNDGVPSAITTALQRGLPILAAVEQTQRGVEYLRAYVRKRPPLPFPVVNVAQCAVKQNIESIILGRRMVRDVIELATDEVDTTVGIVGAHGTVGNAILSALSAHSGISQIIAHNLKTGKENGVYWTRSITDVFENANLIISATGTDITLGLCTDEMDRLSQGRPTKMVNMGSWGEFDALIRYVEPLVGDVPFCTDIQHKNLIIAAGGAPWNLVQAASTGTQPNLHDNRYDFWLTRMLLFLAVVQASIYDTLARSDQHKLMGSMQMLHPGFQRIAVAACKPFITAKHPDSEMARMIEAHLDITTLSEKSVGDFPPDVVNEIIDDIEAVIAENHLLAHSQTPRPA